MIKIAKKLKVLVAGAATALVTTACGTSMRADQPQAAVRPMPKVAVQLYSVKDELRSDFVGTLANLAGLGIDGVEFAGQFGPFRTDPLALKAELDHYELACAGAHTPLPSLMGNRFDTTTAFYLKLGCRNLIIPSDPRAGTLAGAAVVAGELSALSDKLAPLGMRIGYHNHAVEMTGLERQEPWNVIGTLTPGATILQQDVGWTSFAGKDPIEMVRRFPGRTVTTHYKAKIVKGSVGAPMIGEDGTDWTGITQVNRHVGGTEWIIVEQEEYPNGMGQVDAVAASLKGLRRILAAQLPDR